MSKRHQSEWRQPQAKAPRTNCCDLILNPTLSLQYTKYVRSPERNLLQSTISPNKWIFNNAALSHLFLQLFSQVLCQCSSDPSYGLLAHSQRTNDAWKLWFLNGHESAVILRFRTPDWLHIRAQFYAKVFHVHLNRSCGRLRTVRSCVMLFKASRMHPFTA